MDSSAFRLMPEASGKKSKGSSGFAENARWGSIVRECAY
jgi:hypothetical protein